MNSDDAAHVISIVSQRLMRRKEKMDEILPEGCIEFELDRELSTEDYDVDRDYILTQLESNFATLIGLASCLQSDEAKDLPDTPWVRLALSDGNLQWRFWARYRQYLLGNSWPAPVVSRLDQTTTEILDSMMPPATPGSWDQRGLVVGHVQSGKTANYTGLICKAVDAGYKVLVVLAGAHNNLRTQTQIRLEEGFLGYSTIDEDLDRRETTGVGLISPPHVIPDTITTRGDNGDFKTSVAKNFAINPGGNPLLFVVKKNTTVLRNLHNWVRDVARTQGQRLIRAVPLLVIDDESDYASVDTNKQEYNFDNTPDPEHDPTAINRWIRLILRSFEQSVYIGYTATPFANIFIHEKAASEEHGEDLFPRSFIFSLPVPSNYVGPAQMFGSRDEDSEELPIFRTVSDHAASSSLQELEGWIPPKHDKTHVPKYNGLQALPPSLREALRAFLLATAARKARGQRQSHNSMLVHVTRFVDVQERVREQVEEEFFSLRDRILYGDGDRAPLLGELKDLWLSDFVPTSNAIAAEDCHEVTWDEVNAKLTDTVNSITVKAINGSSGDILEYERHARANQPFDVIAIGGDKLSRGLTLEGLTVSYFLRPSKMYDTLMQMGRWFGYRPGYVDMCRIYTTTDLQRWFRHISLASEELREDFEQMVLSKCTPRQFGHRVQNHPQMMVTAPSKMRYTERRTTSFDGCILETILFRRDSEVVEANIRALRALTVGLEADCDAGKVTRDDGKLLWRSVDPSRITSFLEAYHGHPAITKARPEYLRKYIDQQTLRNCLTKWTVYIDQGRGDKYELVDGIKARSVQRAWYKQPDPVTNEDPYRVRRVGDPSHEYIDLDKDQYETALDESVKMWKKNPGGSSYPTTPRGPAIRKVRAPTDGLICIYPVEADLGDGRPVLEHLLIGFFISFPGDPGAQGVQYTVNEVYRRQEEEGFWDE